MKSYFGIAIVFLLVLMAGGCKKDKDCRTCAFTGTYAGYYNNTAGCYGCPPYIDTTYPATLIVSALGPDSILIKNAEDNGSWRLAVVDSGYYAVGVQQFNYSFDFRRKDTLTGQFGSYGSGGYNSTTFLGIKN